MQVNSIELKLGVRLNIGDYQGVNAEVTLKADLDPREGEGGAFDTLRRNAVEMLAAACQSAHPSSIRAAMGGAAPAQAQLAAPAANGAETEEAKAKRTRRTKEQIAADEAAKVRVTQAAEQLGEPAPAVDTDDDMAALLGDAVPDHPPVTPAEAKAMAGQIIKALGGPSLVKLLGEFGAKDFPSLPAAQYGNFMAKAKALIPTA